MKKVKLKVDEDWYKNMYWHPASRRWRWHRPPNKPQEKQPESNLAAGDGSIQDEPKKVYTQEECIRDLQNIFCTGRYRSWAAAHKRK